MTKQYTFGEKLKSSEVGENKILEYLNSLPETVKVTDVSKDNEYQKIDVDLIWETKEKKILIEVKVDGIMSKTGNLFFETISNHIKNTLGCFIYSKADLMYYLDSNNMILYAFDLKLAREWFLDNIESFEERKTSTVQNGKFLYYTIGRLVPLIQLIKNISVKKIQL